MVQETEEVYTPLHLVPPSVPGLIGAIENKYKINATNIRYKQLTPPISGTGY